MLQVSIIRQENKDTGPGVLKEGKNAGRNNHQRKRNTLLSSVERTFELPDSNDY